MMCLSTVFLDRKGDDTVLCREVSRITVRGDSVEVVSLFGDTRAVQGYGVGEVDMVENAIVLTKSGGTNA